MRKYIHYIEGKCVFQMFWEQSNIDKSIVYYSKKLIKTSTWLLLCPIPISVITSTYVSTTLWSSSREGKDNLIWDFFVLIFIPSCWEITAIHGRNPCRGVDIRCEVCLREIRGSVYLGYWFTSTVLDIANISFK